MACDAILFDFDGVLVDSVHIKEVAFGELYKAYGEDVVKKVKKYHISHGGVSRFEKFKYYHQVFLGQELLPEDLENLNIKFSTLVAQLVIDADEMPGAEKVLNFLIQTIPLHVISATPESELEQIITERNMRHFFRSVHGAPQKKSTHIINIIKQYGYDKRKVTMIGDTIADYQSACEADINFIGYAPITECNPFPQHTAVINHLDLIKRVII